MTLPASRVPESVAHLDIEIVSAALVRARECESGYRRLPESSL
jgi:hypothetical protein